jgi:Domain of unknown function (DUF5710)
MRSANKRELLVLSGTDKKGSGRHEFHHLLGVLWKREWLDVPYAQRQRAKMYNARYDEKYKCLYDPFGSASLSAAGLNRYRLRRQDY